MSKKISEVRSSYRVRLAECSLSTTLEMQPKSCLAWVGLLGEAGERGVARVRIVSSINSLLPSSCRQFSRGNSSSVRRSLVVLCCLYSLHVDSSIILGSLTCIGVGGREPGARKGSRRSLGRKGNGGSSRLGGWDQPILPLLCK
jgi:hypothetical protein